MTLRWLSFLPTNGEIITDISTIGYPESPFRKTIGQYDTNQIPLFLDGAPRKWVDGTQPGASCLAVYDDQDPSQKPQWGGLVVNRQRTKRGGTVELSLATLDAYFDRRTVGNQTYSDTGQNDIAQSLVYNYAGDSGRYPGMPFQYVCEDGVGVPGVPRDRTYLDADNATLYARLQQLSGVIGGLEWTVDLEWDDTMTRILPVFRYGSRIGVSPQPGRQPEGVFDGPAVIDATFNESYADGDGANVVVAYSSGQGDVAPTSGPVFAPYNLRPAFEYRYQPSSSITDVDLLVDYAQAAVRFLGEGQSALTMMCQITNSTRYGGTWKNGDDVRGIVEDCASFPGGIDVVARAVAYELDPEPSTISPILAINTIPTDGSSQ